MKMIKYTVGSYGRNFEMIRAFFHDLYSTVYLYTVIFLRYRYPKCDVYRCTAATYD